MWLWVCIAKNEGFTTDGGGSRTRRRRGSSLFAGLFKGWMDKTVNVEYRVGIWRSSIDPAMGIYRSPATKRALLMVRCLIGHKEGLVVVRSADESRARMKGEACRRCSSGWRIQSRKKQKKETRRKKRDESRRQSRSTDVKERRFGGLTKEGGTERKRERKDKTGSSAWSFGGGTKQRY